MIGNRLNYKNYPKLVIICMIFLASAIIQPIYYVNGNSSSSSLINSLHSVSEEVKPGNLVDQVTNNDFSGDIDRSSSPRDQQLTEEGEFDEKHYQREILEKSNLIRNPTQKEKMVYLDPLKGNFQEILESRGSSYRHFYNQSSGMYHYESTQAVYQPGINSKTGWVIKEEYPTKFFVLEKSKKIYLGNEKEISNYTSSISDSSIWAIGIEGFSGSTGFYLNFEDTTDGHGQYLWWPRLKNTSLSPYFAPPLMYYPHISFQLQNNTWLDQILISNSEARKTINFEETGETLRISYKQTLSIHDFIFDFEFGIKYKISEHKFGVIATVICRNGDFKDFTWTYDITSSPFSDNNDFSPKSYVIYGSNQNNKIFPSTGTWNANDHFEDLDSHLEIVTETGIRLNFDFSDMENVGFTKNLISFTELDFGVDNKKEFLIAGMGSYGSYTAGTILNIDPTYTSELWDSSDFYTTKTSSYTASTASTTMMVGYRDNVVASAYHSYLTFYTGIPYDIIDYRVSSFNFGFYIQSTSLETSEWGSIELYDKFTNSYNEPWNETLATASPKTAHLQSTYYTYPFAAWQTGWRSFTASTSSQVILDNWITYHNDAPSSRDEITMKLKPGTGMDATEFNDYATIRESTYGSGIPTIEFDYQCFVPDDPTLVLPSPGNLYPGRIFTITSDHTDQDGRDDIDLVSLNLDSTHDITMDANVDTGTSDYVTITAGSEYLIGTPTWSRTAITNGWRVTWSIRLDWDWDDVPDYKIGLRTEDQFSQISNGGDWVIISPGSYKYENDLIIQDITYSAAAFPNGIEESGGTSIDDGEWIHGGTYVVCSGTIIFQGTAGNEVYPISNSVDVELVTDGLMRGETYDDDTLGSNGEFSIPSFIVGGSTDAFYDFSVTLTDWAGSGSISNWDTVTGADYYVDSGIDATAPTGASFDHSDADSQADGIDPLDGWDDDSVMDYSVSGASDSHSGLSVSPYSYRWDSGSWEAYTGSETYSPTSFDNYTSDADVRIRDKVGNYAEFDGEEVTCDMTNPVLIDSMSGYTEDSGDLGDVFGDISINSLYFSNSLGSAVITFTASMTDLNEYGVIFGSWSGEGGLDTTFPYTGTYNIENADISETLTVTSVDMAGNVDIDSISCIEDTNAPTIDVTSEIESSDHLYAGFGTSYQGVYSSLMPTSQNFTISGNANDDLSGISDIFDDTTFGSNPDMTGILSTWNFLYQISENDNGDVTITFSGVDNVGNVGTVQYTFYEDNVTPTVGTSGIEDGITLNGTIDILISATDSYDIDSVEFEVNGTKIHEDSSTPFTWQWDTATFADGEYLVKVRVTDMTGNVWEETYDVTIETIEGGVPAADLGGILLFVGGLTLVTMIAVIVVGRLRGRGG